MLFNGLQSLTSFGLMSEEKIRIKISETFNVNTNKHKMLRTTVILICSKIKIICKNLFTKVFFNWEITRLIQFDDCLFIEPRISWWSETQTILTCTSHWPVCNSAKLNLYQFPLCHVASQLDVVTLSSNIFPSCTIQNNCGNFFKLNSRFAKAGRRLGPVYMEVGIPRLVRWPA